MESQSVKRFDHRADQHRAGLQARLLERTTKRATQRALRPVAPFGAISLKTALCTAPLLFSALCLTTACGVGVIGNGTDSTDRNTAIVGGAIDSFNRYKAVIDLGCTGTLIGPQTVLTAAHCLFDLEENERRSIPSVYVVETVPPECDSSGACGEATVHRREVPVRATIFHPDFDGSGARHKREPKVNTVLADIGIVILDEPVTEVAPVEFSRHLTLTPGLAVTSVGFGAHRATRNEGQPGTSKRDYDFAVDGFRRIATGRVTDVEGETINVIGDKVFSGTVCWGDSGGPLFIENSRGEPVVVGVLSSMESAACNGLAGYAAITPPYGDWIASYLPGGRNDPADPANFIDASDNATRGGDGLVESCRALEDESATCLPWGSSVASGKVRVGIGTECFCTPKNDDGCSRSKDCSAGNTCKWSSTLFGQCVDGPAYCASKALDDVRIATCAYDWSSQYCNCVPDLARGFCSFDHPCGDGAQCKFNLDDTIGRCVTTDRSATSNNSSPPSNTTECQFAGYPWSVSGYVVWVGPATPVEEAIRNCANTQSISVMRRDEYDNPWWQTWLVDAPPQLPQESFILEPNTPVYIATY